MAIKRYSWKHGPAPIQQHSIAKHHLLRSYLAAYFQTLTISPGQEQFKVTLVDGFAGGGQYFHANTGEVVAGSPLICLQAVKEATFQLNEQRSKPLHIDADFHFVELNANAHVHLIKVLNEHGYGSEIGKSIQISKAKFQDVLGNIISAIKRKTPVVGRSIFVLDQYGYIDVPVHDIRRIFSELPGAEIILTFGVDSFLNFAGDNGANDQLLNDIGIPDLLEGRTWDDIKSSERDWRLWVQSGLYQKLVRDSGAKFYTPFFIRNPDGHGVYWLIHFSQHAKARDVMTEVHWQHHNHFVHYAGAGLDMFQVIGYNPNYDDDFRRQHALGFAFDNVAHRASIAALMDQLPARIYGENSGMTFSELFLRTCNDSPASGLIYREALNKLVQEKILDIVASDGARRFSPNTIKPTDRLIQPRQQSLFLPLKK